MAVKSGHLLGSVYNKRRDRAQFLYRRTSATLLDYRPNGIRAMSIPQGMDPKSCQNRVKLDSECENKKFVKCSTRTTMEKSILKEGKTQILRNYSDPSIHAYGYKKRAVSGATSGQTVADHVTPSCSNESSNSSSKSRRSKQKRKKRSSSVGSGGSLLRAARAGNVEKVITLLDQENVDISTANSTGLTALHLAAKEGHHEVVKALLERGAAPNQASKMGNTGLHITCLAGKIEVVKLLVEHGADVNALAQNSFTPLYMASQEGHVEIVDYLLKHGASNNISTKDGFTPLAVALQEGREGVVALLLEKDDKGRVKLPPLHIAAKKDDAQAAILLLQNENTAETTAKMSVNKTSESGFTALHIAAHYGNLNVAEVLLNRGAMVDFKAKNGITPMHVAAKRGHTRFCAFLLGRHGRPDICTRDGLIPLHCAARSGHFPIVKLFLENEKTPKFAKTKNGLSVLHMAAQGGYAKVIELLLDKGYVVDDVTSDYLSALHIASHCGHVEVVRLLLKRKAYVDCKALNGFTPLHVACKKNRHKVVELLLTHKANKEALTESGLTALHIAAFMGHFNIVELLMRYKVELDTVNVRGETALHMATRAGQTNIVTFLLTNGAKPDARKQESQTCLHLAARLDKLDILKILIQYGAVVDETTEEGYTPLHVAAKEGHVDICEILLDNDASIALKTKKGFIPLHLAAKYGQLETANLLLKKGSPPDASGKDGLTPLHVAAHYDNQQVALLLLKNGASPHSPGKNGYTPLHIAAKKNQMEMAVTLLEYGASPNAKTRMGVTPLHLASQEGHTDLCSLLLSKDAAVNAGARHGLTPMHLAAQEDRVSVAKILHDNGSLVDPLTKSGCTPLHIAAHHGNIDIANYLLSLGAKVNAKTKTGYTPLHQAAQQGHSHIVKLLLEYGASPNELTNSGNTALSLAKRLGYITIEDVLKTVTTETTTIITEERPIPETVNEGFISDASDDEGDESTSGGRFLTSDEMKELGDDSIVPTEASMFAVRKDARYATLDQSSVSPGLDRPRSWTSSTSGNDVGDSKRTSRLSGFLVSFMVDARGGIMQASRHPDMRVLVPPRACRGPTRVTCRLARRRYTAALPPPASPSLFDGEGRATRVVEIGPLGGTFLDRLHCPRNYPPLTEGEGIAARVLQLASNMNRFLGPVAVELPYYANVLENNRQLVVLRSNDGETWKPHDSPCSDQEFRNQFKEEDLPSAEDLASRKVLRIITKDFPKYFAVVTRPIEDSLAIGPSGGELQSSVLKSAKARFPEGSLTKKITVSMQVMHISADTCRRAVGGKAKASSILTIEPRRRKFHKTINLTIPLPEGTDMKDYLSSTEDSTLRLLCSISGGSDPAQWEDITASNPLNFLDNCASFTSSVSARFWLVDCKHPSESSNLAHKIYAEATRVPYMARFVVYAKSHDPLEARLRVFCLTDDKHERTLETQENFEEVARSKDIEMYEGSSFVVECSGNLSAPIKSGQQHQSTFRSFEDNRIQLIAKVRDSTQEQCGRLTFYRPPLGNPKTHGPRRTLCSLNVRLPAYDQDTDSDSDTSGTAEEAAQQRSTSLAEEVAEATRRYFLVDPSTVGMSQYVEEVGSSPEEISRDVGEVVKQLNKVKHLLEPDAPTEGKDKTKRDQGSFESDKLDISETTIVVKETRTGLVALKEILESGDELEVKEEQEDISTLKSSKTLPGAEDKDSRQISPASDLHCTSEECIERLERTSQIFERHVENVPSTHNPQRFSDLHGSSRSVNDERNIREKFEVLSQIQLQQDDKLSVEFEQKVEALTDKEDRLNILSQHSDESKASDVDIPNLSDSAIEDVEILMHGPDEDLTLFLACTLSPRERVSPPKLDQDKIVSEESCIVTVIPRENDAIDKAVRDINSDEELSRFLADDLERHQLPPDVASSSQIPVTEEPVIKLQRAFSVQANFGRTQDESASSSKLTRSISTLSDRHKSVRFYESVTVIDDRSTSPLHALDKTITLQTSLENVCSDQSSLESVDTNTDTAESVSFSPPNSDSEQSDIQDEIANDPPSLTLNDRILAYQKATDELHREVEIFRRLTSPEAPINEESFSSKSAEKSEPSSSAPEQKCETVRLSFAVEAGVGDETSEDQQLSPAVVEESHSVSDLLKTWEKIQTPTQSPAKTIQKSPIASTRKFKDDVTTASDNDQPDEKVGILKPSFHSASTSGVTPNDLLHGQVAGSVGGQHTDEIVPKEDIESEINSSGKSSPVQHFEKATEESCIAVEEVVTSLGIYDKSSSKKDEANVFDDEVHQGVVISSTWSTESCKSLENSNKFLIQQEVAEHDDETLVVVTKPTESVNSFELREFEELEQEVCNQSDESLGGSSEIVGTPAEEIDFGQFDVNDLLKDDKTSIHISEPSSLALAARDSDTSTAGESSIPPSSLYLIPGVIISKCSEERLDTLATGEDPAVTHSESAMSTSNDFSCEIHELSDSEVDKDSFKELTEDTSSLSKYPSGDLYPSEKLADLELSSKNDFQSSEKVQASLSPFSEKEVYDNDNGLIAGRPRVLSDISEHSEGSNVDNEGDKSLLHDISPQSDSLFQDESILTTGNLETALDLSSTTVAPHSRNEKGLADEADSTSSSEHPSTSEERQSGIESTSDTIISSTVETLASIEDVQPLVSSMVAASTDSAIVSTYDKSMTHTRNLKSKLLLGYSDTPPTPNVSPDDQKHFDAVDDGSVEKEETSRSNYELQLSVDESLQANLPGNSVDQLDLEPSREVQSISLVKQDDATLETSLELAVLVESSHGEDVALYQKDMREETETSTFYADKPNTVESDSEKAKLVRDQRSPDVSSFEASMLDGDSFSVDGNAHVCANKEDEKFLLEADADKVPQIEKVGVDTISSGSSGKEEGTTEDQSPYHASYGFDSVSSQEPVPSQDSEAADDSYMPVVEQKNDNWIFDTAVATEQTIEILQDISFRKETSATPASQLRAQREESVDEVVKVAHDQEELLEEGGDTETQSIFEDKLIVQEGFDLQDAVTEETKAGREFDANLDDLFQSNLDDGSMALGDNEKVVEKELSVSLAEEDHVYLESMTKPSEDFDEAASESAVQRVEDVIKKTDASTIEFKQPSIVQIEPESAPLLDIQPSTAVTGTGLLEKTLNSEQFFGDDTLLRNSGNEEHEFCQKSNNRTLQAVEDDDEKELGLCDDRQGDSKIDDTIDSIVVQPATDTDNSVCVDESFEHNVHGKLITQPEKTLRENFPVFHVEQGRLTLKPSAQSTCTKSEDEITSFSQQGMLQEHNSGAIQSLETNPVLDVESSSEQFPDLEVSGVSEIVEETKFFNDDTDSKLTKCDDENHSFYGGVEAKDSQAKDDIAEKELDSHDVCHKEVIPDKHLSPAILETENNLFSSSVIDKDQNGAQEQVSNSVEDSDSLDNKTLQDFHQENIVDYLLLSDEIVADVSKTTSNQKVMKQDISLATVEDDKADSCNIFSIAADESGASGDIKTSGMDSQSSCVAETVLKDDQLFVGENSNKFVEENENLDVKTLEAELFDASSDESIQQVTDENKHACLMNDFQQTADSTLALGKELEDGAISKISFSPESSSDDTKAIPVSDLTYPASYDKEDADIVEGSLGLVELDERRADRISANGAEGLVPPSSLDSGHVPYDNDNLASNAFEETQDGPVISRHFSFTTVTVDTYAAEQDSETYDGFAEGRDDQESPYFSQDKHSPDKDNLLDEERMEDGDEQSEIFGSETKADEVVLEAEMNDPVSKDDEIYAQEKFDVDRPSNVNLGPAVAQQELDLQAVSELKYMNQSEDDIDLNKNVVAKGIAHLERTTECFNSVCYDTERHSLDYSSSSSSESPISDFHEYAYRPQNISVDTPVSSDLVAEIGSSATEKGCGKTETTPLEARVHLLSEEIVDGALGNVLSHSLPKARPAIMDDTDCSILHDEFVTVADNGSESNERHLDTLAQDSVVKSDAESVDNDENKQFFGAEILVDQTDSMMNTEFGCGTEKNKTELSSEEDYDESFASIRSIKGSSSGVEDTLSCHSESDTPKAAVEYDEHYDEMQVSSSIQTGYSLADELASAAVASNQEPMSEVVLETVLFKKKGQSSENSLSGRLNSDDVNVNTSLEENMLPRKQIKSTTCQESEGEKSDSAEFVTEKVWEEAVVKCSPGSPRPRGLSNISEEHNSTETLTPTSSVPIVSDSDQIVSLKPGDSGEEKLDDNTSDDENKNLETWQYVQDEVKYESIGDKNAALFSIADSSFHQSNTGFTLSTELVRDEKILPQTDSVVFFDQDLQNDHDSASTSSSNLLSPCESRLNVPSVVVTSQSTELLVLSHATLQTEEILSDIPRACGDESNLEYGENELSHSVSGIAFTDLARERAAADSDQNTPDSLGEATLIDMEAENLVESFEERKKKAAHPRTSVSESFTLYEQSVSLETSAMSDSELFCDGNEKDSQSFRRNYSVSSTQNEVLERPVTPTPLTLSPILDCDDPDSSNHDQDSPQDVLVLCENVSLLSTQSKAIPPHNENKGEDSANDDFSAISVPPRPNDDYNSLAASRCLSSALTPLTGDSVGEVSAGEEFSFQMYPGLHNTQISVNSAATVDQFLSDEVFTSGEFHSTVSDSDSTSVIQFLTTHTYSRAETLQVEPVPEKNLLSETEQKATTESKVQAESEDCQRSSLSELNSKPLPETQDLTSHTNDKSTTENKEIDRTSASIETVKSQEEYAIEEKLFVPDTAILVHPIADVVEIRSETIITEKSASAKTCFDAAANEGCDDADESLYRETESVKDISSQEVVDEALFDPSFTTSSDVQCQSETIKLQTSPDKLSSYYGQQHSKLSSDDEPHSECFSVSTRKKVVPRSSRIPIAKSDSLKKSSMSASCKEIRKSRAVDFRLSQSLPTRTRRPRLSRENLKALDVRSHSLAITSATSTSRLPVRRTSLPRVKKKQKRNKHHDLGNLTSPGSTSTFSRSSSSSNISLKFRRSCGSSPVQDSVFRNEPFTNKMLNSKKYIALREGVFTYKTSPALEKEESEKSTQGKPVASSVECPSSSNVRAVSGMVTGGVTAVGISASAAPRSTNNNGNKLSFANPFLDEGPRLDSGLGKSSGFDAHPSESSDDFVPNQTVVSSSKIVFDSAVNKAASRSASQEWSCLTQSSEMELYISRSNSLDLHLRSVDTSSSYSVVRDSLNAESLHIEAEDVSSYSPDSIGAYEPTQTLRDISFPDSLNVNAGTVDLSQDLVNIMDLTSQRSNVVHDPQSSTDSLNQSRVVGDSGAQASLFRYDSLERTTVRKRAPSLSGDDEARDDSLDEDFRRGSNSDLSSDSMDCSCSSVIREVEAEAARAVSITPDSVETLSPVCPNDSVARASMETQHSLFDLNSRLVDVGGATVDEMHAMETCFETQHNFDINLTDLIRKKSTDAKETQSLQDVKDCGNEEEKAVMAQLVKSPHSSEASDGVSSKTPSRDQTLSPHDAWSPEESASFSTSYGQPRDSTLDQSLQPEHRAVASQIGLQWPQLAGALGLSSADVWRIQKQCDGTPDGTHSKVMMKVWLETHKEAATVDRLRTALNEIDRGDLITLLQEVTSAMQQQATPRPAKTPHDDSSAFHALSSELGSPFPVSAQHVSSPFPFPAHKPTIPTSTPTVSKAQGEMSPRNETMARTPPNTATDDLDDLNKPHFVYGDFEDDASEKKEDSSSDKQRERRSRTSSRSSVASSSTTSGEHVMKGDRADESSSSSSDESEAEHDEPEQNGVAEANANGDVDDDDDDDEVDGPRVTQNVVVNRQDNGDVITTVITRTIVVETENEGEFTLPSPKIEVSNDGAKVVEITRQVKQKIVISESSSSEQE